MWNIKNKQTNKTKQNSDTESRLVVVRGEGAWGGWVKWVKGISCTVTDVN